MATGRAAAVAAGGPARARVLFAATDVLNHGGIQRFNRTLVAALRTLDVDVDIVSLNDAEGLQSGTDEIRGAAVTGFGRNKARFAAGLIHLLATRRYDTLLVGHVHFARMVAICCRLPGLVVPPRTILLAHGLEVWASIHGGTRRALRAFTDVFAVSKFTRDAMIRQAPELASRPMHVFPNALAEIWVARADEIARRARADAGAQRPRPFLLSVTRLGANERTKGIVTALEAFAGLGDPDLDYVIAGQGDDLDFLRDCAARLGVGDRVRFIGGVSDAELAVLYRDCHAFVLPSGQEGFGIVYLEAMYFGAPVIAARAKGVVDVVADGATGLLVAFGDVVGLGTALGRICADATLRARLRANGAAQVTGNGPFTFGAFVARLATILGVAEPLEGSRDVDSSSLRSGIAAEA